MINVSHIDWGILIALCALILTMTKMHIDNRRSIAHSLRINERNGHKIDIMWNWFKSRFHVTDKEDEDYRNESES